MKGERVIYIHTHLLHYLLCAWVLGIPTAVPAISTALGEVAIPYEGRARKQQWRPALLFALPLTLLCIFPLKSL